MRDFKFPLDLKPVERHWDEWPDADIAICSACGWRGHVSMCPQEEEGDWETGYYKVHVCPKCEDGGCVDDYDYSDELVLTIWELHNG